MTDRVARIQTTFQRCALHPSQSRSIANPKTLIVGSYVRGKREKEKQTKKQKETRRPSRDGRERKPNRIALRTFPSCISPFLYTFPSGESQKALNLISLSTTSKSLPSPFPFRNTTPRFAYTLCYPLIVSRAYSES